MRISTLLTSASLVSAVIAAPAGHQHKNKRDAVTTTVHNMVTVQVTVGPDGNVLGAPAAAVATPAPVAAAAKVDAKPDVKADAKPDFVAESSEASSVPASADLGSGSKGITYSPYTDSGMCKSTSEVATDLAKLTEFGVIRLYGVDCDQVANVLQAKTANQKLFLGIYYVDQIEAGVQTMASAISSYGSWNDVYTVSIGNELVNSGAATPAQIGGYVSAGRSALTAAGYSGPVVSVDTFIAVINNPELCKYSDYMAVNAHAFFDAHTVAADAGPWVLHQIQRVWTTCGGAKDVMISESGWPSKGEACGVAIPSAENQAVAIASIKHTCGADVLLYTAFNDYWKANGAYNAEKYWGILN